MLTTGLKRSERLLKNENKKAALVLWRCAFNGFADRLFLYEPIDAAEQKTR